MSERDDNQEPGQSLRLAREEAGLSAKEVADSLNLLVSNVEALEANNYRHMNADIFVRGYVKSYARFLGLDPEPLLAAAEKRLNRDHDEVPAKTTDNVSGGLARGGLSTVQKVAVALIVAAVLWLAANLTMVAGGDDHSALLFRCEQAIPADRASADCDLEIV